MTIRTSGSNLIEINLEIIQCFIWGSTRCLSNTDFVFHPHCSKLLLLVYTRNSDLTWNDRGISIIVTLNPLSARQDKNVCPECDGIGAYLATDLKDT